MDAAPVTSARKGACRARARITAARTTRRSCGGATRQQPRGDRSRCGTGLVVVHDGESREGRGELAGFEQEPAAARPAEPFLADAVGLVDQPPAGSQRALDGGEQRTMKEPKH